MKRTTTFPLALYPDTFRLLSVLPGRKSNTPAKKRKNLSTGAPFRSHLHLFVIDGISLSRCALLPPHSLPHSPSPNRPFPSLSPNNETPARIWRSKMVAPSRMPLSSFSTWMTDFDPHVHALEVPGQYGGISTGPPRTSHHSRIIR